MKGKEKKYVVPCTIHHKKLFVMRVQYKQQVGGRGRSNSTDSNRFLKNVLWIPDTFTIRGKLLSRKGVDYFRACPGPFFFRPFCICVSLYIINLQTFT